MPPPSGISALWARTRGALRRLNSPDDTHAAAAVAALLLCAEAVLCLLIITKVPCERPLCAALPVSCKSVYRSASSAT